LDQALHVGVSTLRLYVNPHWIRATERRDDHALGVGDIEREI
jgi:hypothetical protein